MSFPLFATISCMNDTTIAGFFLDGWYVFDNYAPLQVEWRGKLYPTSEHAYQAAHFIDNYPELAEKIRLCRSPGEASDMANENSEFDDPDWREKRLNIMEEILRCKLRQHELVSETLRKSGNKTIVEMNDDDDFWGWGRGRNGRNELGKIWMKLREELNSR